MTIIHSYVAYTVYNSSTQCIWTSIILLLVQVNVLKHPLLRHQNLNFRHKDQALEFSENELIPSTSKTLNPLISTISED